jgi:hypothetical protein
LFLFTRRGWAGAWFLGLGAGSAGAPLLIAGAVAGVLELRFGPAATGAVFGTSRRVTSPWPTVHRFVVTQ